MMTVRFYFSDGSTIEKDVSLDYPVLALDKAVKTIRATHMEILSVNP